jgi:hypothetical protein
MCHNEILSFRQGQSIQFAPNISLLTSEASLCDPPRWMYVIKEDFNLNNQEKLSITKINLSEYQSVLLPYAEYEKTASVSHSYKFLSVAEKIRVLKPNRDFKRAALAHFLKNVDIEI